MGSSVPTFCCAACWRSNKYKDFLHYLWVGSAGPALPGFDSSVALAAATRWRVKPGWGPLQWPRGPRRQMKPESGLFWQKTSAWLLCLASSAWLTQKPGCCQGCRAPGTWCKLLPIWRARTAAGWSPPPAVVLGPLPPLSLWPWPMAGYGWIGSNRRTQALKHRSDWHWLQAGGPGQPLHCSAGGSCEWLMWVAQGNLIPRSSTWLCHSDLYLYWKPELGYDDAAHRSGWQPAVLEI